MNNLKKCIVALTLVFILSGVSHAGQMDMPVAPPPPPQTVNMDSSTIGGPEPAAPAEGTLSESVFILIRDFLSIF